MKFYPSTASINYSNKTDLNTEIPLAYINTNYAENTININIHEKYNYDKVKEVLPYDIFNSKNDGFPEITLFNKDKSEITINDQQEMLIRKSNTYDYMYIPKSYITFEPYTFYYSVLAKKKIKYTSIRKFNIKIAFNDKSLAKNMIKYFTPLNGKTLYPSNITFNNNDSSLNSFMMSSLDDLDFLFISCNDGEHYLNGEIIDIDELLNYSVIPVIICNQYTAHSSLKNPLDKGIEMQFKLKENTVMNSPEIVSDGYFEVPQNGNDYSFLDLFMFNPIYAPVLVKEFTNKGYVIYCKDNFVAELDKYYANFYNILMTVYLNGYIKTKRQKEWITDVIPDYIVENGQLVQKDKFTSKIELNKLLNLYENDAYPIKVEITNKNCEIDNNVYYTGMSSNYLVFKKVYLKDISDPVKEPNQISIYTSRKNIMYYDRFTYTIEQNIKNNIKCNIKNNTLYINITPFKNTYLNTRNFKYPINLNYELKDELTQSIYLLWNKDVSSVYYSEEYTENDILLAEIIITKDKKTTYLYDMRQRGGGLSDDDEKDADCFDINNVYGKAYRRGGSLIATVTLPKKYSNKHDEIYNIIYKSLRKNMIADDYLILNLEYE